MKTKLIVVAAVILCISIVYIQINLHNETRKELIEKFRTEQEITTRHFSEEVETFLRVLTENIESLTSFRGLQDGNIGEIKKIVDEDFEYFKEDQVKSISVYNNKGVIIYSTIKDAIGYNDSESNFFKWTSASENKGEPFISSERNEHKSRTLQMPVFSLLIAVPVYKHVENTEQSKSTEKFIGVVTAVVDLEETLIEILPRISPDAKKENVMVLDKDGTLWYQSEHPEMVMKNIHTRDKSCFQCHDSFAYIEKMLTEKRGIIDYQLKKSPKKAASFSSFSFKNISWTIVLNHEYQGVTGFLDKSLIYTLIIIGSIILTILWAVVIIFRSNRLKVGAEAEAKQWREKRELEDKIRESEEHLRMVIDVSPDAIIIHCGGKIVFVNPAAVELVGALNQNELLGKPVIEFVHPDEREFISKHILEIVKNEKPSTWIEERLLKIDGSIINVEVISTPTTFNGKPSLQVIVHNITERKLAEEKLKIYMQTIRSTNDIINVADLNDNILFVNHAFCKTYGYTEEELIGINSSIFWSDRNPKEVVEQILPATLNGGWKGELFNKRKDGTEFPVYLSTSVIKNDSGEQIAFVGIVEDITEQKREDLERKVMQEITQGVTTTSHLDELLKLIHESLKKVIYAENCFVALYDRNTEFFSFPYWVDKFEPIPEPEPVGKGCAAYVLRTGKPLLVTQELFVQLKKQNEVELEGSPSKSWVGIPLQVDNRTIGVLVLKNYEEENIYSERDVQFLNSLGSQIALVIERKRVEEELRNERLLLRTVIDNIPDSIYCKDSAGRKTLANFTELRYSGVESEKEILGKTDFDLYPKELAEGFFADDQSVIQSGKPVLNREEYLFNEKGEKQWLLTSKLPLKDEKGNIVGIVGIGRNITLRKQAEEALKESDRFLKETQIITQLGTYTLDIASGRWASSDILDRLFGIDADYDKSVEGWESLIHPDWQKIMADYFIKEVIGEKVKFNKEYKIVRRNDKSERWVHGIGELKFNENDQPITMIGTIRDITDRKQAEEEIKKQNEELLKINAEKDKFFSIIAHDLRSPFQGFLVMTEMITENSSEFSYEEIETYIGELNKSAQNIYKLLQNLLDWAQLKKGSFDFTPGEFSLAATVSTSIEQINKRAIQKEITIVTEVPENQKIFVDERMINSILGNLLSNAVKFTGKDGKVTVKAKTGNNGMVEIAVEDSGVGISERTLNKLFKIDQKVGRKGTDGELSTGLGLLLCKEFVEKHGGKIWVESEEGKGSRFIFTMPGANRDTIEMQPNI